MRHLLSIEDLDRPGIERILDRAKSFTEVSEREVKKVPALRGRRVLNLFYEASTRTRSSFELAAKTLSAEVINFVSSGSAVEKGESLKDTVQTLSAYRPDLIVVRTPHVGAAGLIAGWTDAGVVNAGDGKHEHPTQALLDVYTLRERLGALDGLSIWIVGDVLHSRVARSNILAFTMLGANVTVCGPPTLIPRGVEALGCDVEYRLAAVYQVDGRRLSARQVLMHPGPVNRGVELSAEVIDSPQAVIGQQVAAGVVVRMAVLYELLAGRSAPATAPSTPAPQLA
jgi:aspartate carbamoyltransferase catalytic subunit